MRKPTEIEYLYLDMDGYFASVEQQARPALRGKPVGVVPFPQAVNLNINSCVIAASKEAKARGVKNIMSLKKVRAVCPEIILVAQSPDLYRRAYDHLLNEINMVIPIGAVKSIDELYCELDKRDRADALGLAAKIKQRLSRKIGPHITCSIGFGPNPMIAKIACKLDKPNGVTIIKPADLPGPLLSLPFDDIPGIGTNLQMRLASAGIGSMRQIWESEPKQLRQIWGNVNGEKMWYALHGYAVKAQKTEKGMFGHSRVLPPKFRSMDGAYGQARVLLTKAARRLRGSDYYAAGLSLWLSTRKGTWQGRDTLPFVKDDHAFLESLARIWGRACEALGMTTVFRIGVVITDITKNQGRQLDLLTADDVERRKWEAICLAVDGLNKRYGKTAISVGFYKKQKDDFTGAKIAFGRVPEAEDFW